MSPAIWLIAEDATDSDIMRQIFERKGINATLRQVRLPGGTGGISRLSHHLAKLIEQIRAERAWHPDDCIVVLHDLDAHLPDRNNKLYENVARICQRKGAIHLTPDDKIEAWMLADKGLCKFLGKNIKARNWDRHPEVKDKLEAHLRRKKMTYSGRDRQKVIEHLDGTGDLHSPSMQKSLSTLRERECF